MGNNRRIIELPDLVTSGSFWGTWVKPRSQSGFYLDILSGYLVYIFYIFLLLFEVTAEFLQKLFAAVLLQNRFQSLLLVSDANTGAFQQHLRFESAQASIGHVWIETEESLRFQISEFFAHESLVKVTSWNSSVNKLANWRESFSILSKRMEKNERMGSFWNSSFEIESIWSAGGR